MCPVLVSCWCLQLCEDGVLFICYQLFLTRRGLHANLLFPSPPTFPSVSASKKNSLFQSCTMVESLENLTMECRSSVVGDVAIKIETSIVA